jgi:hypothetical protein
MSGRIPVLQIARYPVNLLTVTGSRYFIGFLLEYFGFWQLKFSPFKFGKENIHKSGPLKFPARYILFEIFMLSWISGRIPGIWLLD